MSCLLRSFLQRIMMKSALALLVIIVIVFVKDAFPQLDKPTISGFTARITVGTNFTWTCVDLGPMPCLDQVQWLKSGQPIPPTAVSGMCNEIYSKVAVAEDQGIYRCQTNSMSASTLSDPISLTVVVPPGKPSISGFIASIRTGTTFTWTCAEPGATNFEWWKTGDLSQLTGTTGASGEIYSKIAAAGDQGTYYCKASNSAGVAQSDSISLTVTASSGGDDQTTTDSSTLTPTSSNAAGVGLAALPHAAITMACLFRAYF
ncbi:carcinoembryonic antigen-related cell adhesion molecule 6-like [Lineus longissimus]|uniref:carcinoembryonic antigen-related cell adhesion molecule 6-like n=1 Tax=Lineus longissimus TaxID=88925 RepID=UPI00315DEAA8